MIASKLIRYWRDSLIDSTRSDAATKRLARATRVPFEDAAAGQVNAKRVAVLFENAKDEGKRDRTDDAALEPLPVLLCLMVLRKAGRSVQGNGNLLGVLWLPAELAQDGALQPSRDLPWIPRNLLEPVDNAKADLTVGDVDALDAFLTEHPEPVNAANPEATPRWRDAWSYAEAMFRRVTGASVDAFTDEAFEKSEYVYLLRAGEEDKNIPARHTLRLYEHLLRSRDVPPLLEHYMLLRPPPPRPLLTPREEVAASAGHLGQMSARYPLFPSQRKALHHLLAGANDGILAVSGPPGTGKTTLLQSVVAALWVEAAVEGGEPPVIVATSANNQAITNVIARLGESAEDASILSGRWLPRVTSYGLYCPAASRDEPGVQISRPYDGGFTLTSGENAEAQGYVGEAEAYFIAACNLWVNRAFGDVEAAVTALQEALVRVTQTIRRGPQAWLKLDKARRDVEEKYGGSPEEAVSRLKEEVAALEREQVESRNVYRAWGGFDEKAPFWYTVFGFLSSVKKRRARRNRRYFEEHAFEIDADLSNADSIEAFFNKREADLGRQARGKQRASELAEADATRLRRAEAEWAAWCEVSRVHTEPPLLLDDMDTRLRYTAFKLATHYWEGRWLLEMKAWLAKDPDLKERKGEAAQAARWRRYAKLAPCVVSTFYMLPAFFDAFDKAEGAGVPLYSFIDLLIVDEAGQAAPDVAAAAFALAERALVVGDTKQLEPVFTLDRGVDTGNIRKHELEQQGLTFDALTTLGLSASGGNVMCVAKGANRFKADGAGQAELLLTEHHRCVPEVMAYFNELAYDNRLVPVRPSVAGHPLPPLGYAHVPGESVKHNRSRTNPVEAQVVVDWLVDQRDTLESYYARPLEEIVAAVTPFKPQATLLDRLLRQKGLSGLKVGTVHVLQGGEREVVLFSSVYGAKDPPSYFFDRGVNMLNVAVSRARDSFLVFGNMAVFRRGGATPSGLLGKYLFKDAENELTDVRLPPREITAAKTKVAHLDTLEAHRAALAEALCEATSSVHITSPFLTEAAVLADDLPALVGRAVARGVRVSVYADPQLNETRGKPKPSFLEARRLLKNSGAEVHDVRGEHSKTLITDDTVLIEGSFNWLSAVRDERSAYRRRERSLRYEGQGVDELIRDILLDTKGRVVREAGERP